MNNMMKLCGKLNSHAIRMFDFSALKRHLSMLVDVVKQAYPTVKKVTTIQTVCDAMNSNATYKVILSEVHKLLRLYLTIPITSALLNELFRF